MLTSGHMEWLLLLTLCQDFLLFSHLHTVNLFLTWDVKSSYKCYHFPYSTHFWNPSPRIASFCCLCFHCMQFLHEKIHNCYSCSTGTAVCFKGYEGMLVWKQCCTTNSLENQKDSDSSLSSLWCGYHGVIMLLPYGYHNLNILQADDWNHARSILLSYGYLT